MEYGILISMLKLKISTEHRTYFAGPTNMEGGMIVITFVLYVWKPSLCLEIYLSFEIIGKIVSLFHSKFSVISLFLK